MSKNRKIKQIHRDPFNRWEREDYSMRVHTYTHTHAYVKACACVHLHVKSSVLIFMVINSGGYLAAGAADQALIESKCVCWKRGRVTWNGSNVFLIELSVFVCVCVATGVKWSWVMLMSLSTSSNHAKPQLLTWYTICHSDEYLWLINGVCQGNHHQYNCSFKAKDIFFFFSKKNDTANCFWGQVCYYLWSDLTTTQNTLPLWCRVLHGQIFSNFCEWIPVNLIGIHMIRGGQKISPWRFCNGFQLVTLICRIDQKKAAFISDFCVSSYS